MSLNWQGALNVFAICWAIDQLIHLPKTLRAVRASWRRLRAARAERDWEKSWSQYAEQRRAGEIAKRRENQPKVRHHSADFRPDSE